MTQNSTSNPTVGITWNGGVCSTCGDRYLGAHRCTRTCPCRPENGGSADRAAADAGPQVTC